MVRGHPDPHFVPIKYQGESKFFTILPSMFPEGAEFEEVEEDPSNVGGRRRRKQSRKPSRKHRKSTKKQTRRR